MKLQHLLLVFLLSSCSTTIKNLDLYQKQFLSRTEFMPSSERLDGKAPKIVVFPLDENDNPTNFQVISLPPRFIYNSNVAGNIKIYELPSLTVIEAIEFEGKRARTENVQQKGGVSIGMLQIGGEKVKGVERDDGLVRRAGQDAVEEVEIAIKNAFAKTGYILEKRVNGSKTIFKINLGSMDGIKQNDKFEVRKIRS